MKFLSLSRGWRNFEFDNFFSHIEFQKVNDHLSSSKALWFSLNSSSLFSYDINKQ